MIKKILKTLKGSSEEKKEETSTLSESRAAEVVEMSKYLEELFPNGEFYTVSVMIRKENFERLMEILGSSELNMGIIPSVVDIVDDEGGEFNPDDLIDAHSLHENGDGDKGPLQ